MAAEKDASQAAAAPATTGDAAPKPKGKLKPMILVAVLMIGEGVGLFAVMKILGAPPEHADAHVEDEHVIADPLNLAASTEVKLCEVDAFNRKEGRLYVYHIQLTALVDTKEVETITKFAEARAGSIAERIQVVIRAADPKDLNDPSLETIKRQIKFELNNLLGGKELIQDVLISKLLQSRSSL